MTIETIRTRINIPKHERSRDNTPENSSWSNYGPPRSHRWISFQFSSTRYSSYAALETKTYYLPGEIRPFPDHVNYGNCRLLARANSPKSALSTGFATRVISSETLFECGCLPLALSRRVSTFLGLISFCTVISSARILLHCSTITIQWFEVRFVWLKRKWIIILEIIIDRRVNKYWKN